MNSNIITAKENRPAAVSIRNIRTITSIALLAAASFALAFFEFPVPLSPSFARMDLSNFPALVGTLTIGPTAGVAVELVKNLLGLPSTSTGGVGELVNFLIRWNTFFCDRHGLLQGREKGMAGLPAGIAGHGRNGGGDKLFHPVALI